MHAAPVVVAKNLNDVVVSNMIIFLRDIPAKTSKNDIVDHFDPLLKGGLFEKTGQIENVQILALKDTKENTYEFHGLVTIDSDAVAKRIIKKLNRKAFIGKPIIVREYFHRSWQNDRRVNMGEWNDELEDRRKGSRRRTDIENVQDLVDDL